MHTLAIALAVAAALAVVSGVIAVAQFMRTELEDIVRQVNVDADD